MMKLDNAIWVGDSMTAWEELNEAFIKADPRFHFLRGHGALYAYDIVIGIREPKVDPNFDFGRHFNYTMNKWKSLVANYVDKEELSIIKQEVTTEETKRNSSKVYNLALQFTNKHGHGKNCLLSMVFSHRLGDTKPTISVFLRASEVTKRLICDLLLFQRIGEYVYEDTPFQMVIHFNQIFNDDTVLLMYDVHHPIQDIIIDKGERSTNLIKRLKELKRTNPEDIKYKVHRRAAKVLHPELYKYPKTLAKDCKL